MLGLLSPPCASAAPSNHAAEKAAAAKKKKEAVDDDLANLMADMEAVEKKRCGGRLMGEGMFARLRLASPSSLCAPGLTSSVDCAGKSKQPRSARAKTPSRRKSRGPCGV